MASWVTCTTTDGAEIRVNLDQVAVIRPYRSDRGFSGSEVIFATGQPSPVIVTEDRDMLIGHSKSYQKFYATEPDAVIETIAEIPSGTGIRDGQVIQR